MQVSVADIGQEDIDLVPL